MDVNVYSITHLMAASPSEKSKRAVIDADVDKMFKCKMMRDLDGERLKTALKEAYAMNGYTDQKRSTGSSVHSRAT